ncbi:MAG: hypothetical protein K8T26_18045 [Lentisphaerae bacterium]|nr:hypothetical protein [Lentisphaerota bacterium]
MPELNHEDTKGREYRNRFRILLNALSSGATQVLSLSLLVWLHQYLLRHVTPEEYALYPLCVSLMVFAPLLSGVFTSGISRYLVQADARREVSRIAEIVSTMQVIVAGVATVMLAIGAGLYWQAEALLALQPSQVPEARRMLALLVIAAAVRLLLSPQAAGLEVRQRFVAQNAIAIGSELVRLGLLYGLLTGIGPRVLWVVVASTVASVGQQALVVLASRRVMPELRFRAAAVRLPGAREIVTFGGWSYVANMANKFGSALPPILLSHFAPALQVGAFHLGTQAPRQIQALLRAFRVPLLPVVTGLIARHDMRAAGEAYLRTGRYMLWLSMLPAVPLFVFRHELVHLYVGDRYAAAAGVLACLLAHSAVAAGNSLFPQLALATGRVRSWAVCAWFAEALHLGFALYFVVVRDLGAFGAALGYLLSGTFAQSLFAIPLGLHHAQVSLRLWLRETILLGALPAMGALAVLAFVRAYAAPATWAALAAAAVGGGLVQSALVVLCAHPEDRRDFRALWARVHFKIFGG